MVGAGRIPGGRSNAAVFLLDQKPGLLLVELGLSGEPFVLPNAALVSHNFMQVLRSSFRQTITQRLYDDGRVIVARVTKRRSEFIHLVAHRQRETAKEINALTVPRRHVVGQRAADLTLALETLLAQEMETGQRVRSCLVGVHLHIFAHRIGWPKSRYGARGKALVRDDVLQHFLAVSKKFLRLLADFRLVENGRVNTVQLPRPKEGRPIDVGGQHVQWNFLKMLQTHDFRPANFLIGPVGCGLGGAGLGERNDIFATVIAAGKFLA